MNRTKLLILVLLLLSCNLFSPGGEVTEGTTPDGRTPVGPTYVYVMTLPPKTAQASPPLPTDTSSVIPSDTPSYTNTPAPTDTPTSIPTPTPTWTPTPTPTVTPTQIPIPPQALIVPYQGEGDSVFNPDLNRVGGAGVLEIMGNASGNYFSVTTLDSNGNYVDTLVNTTQPYSGSRPINLREGENTAWVQVRGVGYWSIWLLPLYPGIVTTIDVPGVVVGRGDDVVMITGRIPELARIRGNEDTTHFAIFAYTRDDREMLFNTTDPYSGVVILPSGTYILEVVAVGDWTIEIDAKY